MIFRGWRAKGDIKGQVGSVESAWAEDDGTQDAELSRDALPMRKVSAGGGKLSAARRP